MKSEDHEGGTLDTLSPAEVAAAMEKGEIILIDVRTPQEFAYQRIPGALLAPMQEFDPHHLPGGDAKRIVFHCGSGVRSKAVAGRCIKAGARHAAHLEGGFGGWVEAGREYIGTDPQTGGPKRMRKG